MKVLSLADAIDELSSFDTRVVLCVRRPWAADAQCAVVMANRDGGVPKRVKDAGFEYFLEASIAREVPGVFGRRGPTREQKVRLLIHYAENDAYPDWVYK